MKKQPGCFKKQKKFAIQIFPPRIELCCFLQGKMLWKGRVSHLKELKIQLHTYY